MEVPSFKEDHISQIPALQILIKLGYVYLSPEETLTERNEKTTSVLLEHILEAQLKKLNKINYKGKEHSFSENNIKAAIRDLKNVPLHEGYIKAAEYAYQKLTLGESYEQSIDSDKKSFSLQYIDWKNLENNVYHVTEEFPVMRSGRSDNFRPDIVLFVNGIPFVVIEAKRPDLKEPVKKAIDQHLRNQHDDGIRPLFVYSQMLLSISTTSARFGTTGTSEKFWSIWKEKFESIAEEKDYEKELTRIKNEKLSDEEKGKLFGGRFFYVKKYFEELEKENLNFTEQDKYLYGLCMINRLMELAFNFIVFESGEKKVARYQQYFAINKTMDWVKNIEGGRRCGGVIWHTQGSGKSLTMVMLAQKIAMEKNIRNPKIVLVTDRIALDDQLTKTFEKCNIFVDNAATGEHLVQLLKSKSDAVVTTIINKFKAAVNKIRSPFESSNIFVLVDEGHRSQYGEFNISMQKVFPNACFIGFTGTPLMKEEKNTARKFGGMIDTYTIDEAVEDKAVVPLLYEGRHALQEVNAQPLDNYFNKISEPLTEYQKADLKKKYSRADQLNIAEQKIYSIAWDISEHFNDNWGDSNDGNYSGFKGLVVTQNKWSAIRYKNFFDEIGRVTTEVVISPPDEREGNDDAYSKTDDIVLNYWERIKSEHGTAERYEKNVISRFKNQDNPKLLIVVDKLITGFDVPRMIVLYLTRKLTEHSLLQAMARVNRVYPGKDFGFIIDYYGVLGELDEALNTYSALEEFDENELEGTVVSIKDEIEKLDQRHSELWDIFKIIENKRDAEAYEKLLRDKAIRSKFYDKLSFYARTLKIALSAIEFYRETPDEKINRYKEDAKFFLQLRVSVKQRYSDAIDYKEYEPQIQKLIDKHISTSEVIKITDQVNIFDTERFQQEVEKIVGDAAKADMIASRTAKHINERMEEDPAFYKKFSDLLKETIKDYEDRRYTEAEYLKRVKNIHYNIVDHTDPDSPIPTKLKQNPIAQTFFRTFTEVFKKRIKDKNSISEASTEAGLLVDKVFKEFILDDDEPKVDWQNKSNLIGKLKIHIGDLLIDEINEKYKLGYSLDEIDELVETLVSIAERRYK